MTSPLLDAPPVGLARRMRNAIVLGQRLRQVLSNSLPGVSTADAYTRLKSPFAPHLTQADLFPFCDAVKIDRKELPLVLSRYGVVTAHIFRKQWKVFYEDQVCAHDHSLSVPPAVAPLQETMLRRLAGAIRARCPRDLPGQWQLIAKRNPSGASPAQIRLSSICRFVQELRLAFDHAPLIDALLTFFGEGIESINFNQFTKFMQTFN
jgi:hypothetical protein